MQREPLHCNDLVYSLIRRPDAKENFKRYFWILRDGSVTEAVYLDVPDQSLREEVVLNHYLMQRAQLFETCILGVNILSRDNPWDFEIETSQGDHFYLEITSFSDSNDFLRKLSAEEFLKGFVDEQRISFSRLQKIAQMFPGSIDPDEINFLRTNGTKKTELVENPFFGERSRLFTSIETVQPRKLSESILGAIHSKSRKAHGCKDNTILILDNRTSRANANELLLALRALDSEVEGFPFPEIWVYTGYYSSFDGSNAEFSFTPVKLSQKGKERLKTALEARNLTPDDNGVVHVSADRDE